MYINLLKTALKTNTFILILLIQSPLLPVHVHMCNSQSTSNTSWIFVTNWNLKKVSLFYDLT